MSGTGEEGNTGDGREAEVEMKSKDGQPENVEGSDSAPKAES